MMHEHVFEAFMVGNTFRASLDAATIKELTFVQEQRLRKLLLSPLELPPIKQTSILRGCLRLIIDEVER